MKKRFASVIGVALLAMTFGSIAPANASITGGAVILVTCNLPSWPVASGLTGCNGTATGAIAGVTNGGTPYAVACAPTCAVSTVGGATGITYGESCVGPVPATGFAFGELKVSGGLPAAADLYEPFTWTRVGAVAAITTGTLSSTIGSTTGPGFVDFDSDGDNLDAGDATDVVGDVAVGALVPTSVPGTCGASTPLTVLVPAVDVLAA